MASHSSLRSSLQQFRVLGLLHAEVDLCFGPSYLALFQLAMVVLPVFELHVFVRYHHHLPPFVAFAMFNILAIALLYVLVAYPLAARLGTRSADLRHALLRQTLHPLLRRQLREIGRASCRERV